MRTLHYVWIGTMWFCWLTNLLILIYGVLTGKQLLYQTPFTKEDVFTNTFGIGACTLALLMGGQNND